MITNPGNILPIYDNIRDQWRFRWGHTEFGIVADLGKLIPFQLKIAGGDSLLQWQIISSNGDEIYEEDVSTLEIISDDGGAYLWYVWHGLADIDARLECGLYFMRFETGRAVYYSEMLRVEDIAGYENAGLSASCAANEVTLNAADTVNTSKTYEVIQQLDNDGITWNTVGGTSYTVPNDTVGPTETYRFRRVVRTAGGSYLTTYYTLFFEVLDACGSYILTPYNTENWSTRSNRALLSFTNAGNDTKDVIYQTGYTQKAYLDAYMDHPEATVENETTIDGNGRVRILASNTKEKTVFEFPRLPDFWIGVLSYLPFMDTKTISFHELADTHTMEEVEFSYRKAEDGYYAVGRLAYRQRQFFDQSCDPPYEISVGAP